MNGWKALTILLMVLELVHIQQFPRSHGDEWSGGHMYSRHTLQSGAVGAPILGIGVLSMVGSSPSQG